MTYVHWHRVGGLALGLAMMMGQAIPLSAQDAPPDSDTPSPAATGPRFACQVHNGQYTVMYLPQSQPGEAYPWAIPEDMGSAWPAERRCNEISRRLESYRPDGLVEMLTAVENGYNTVCVTTEAVPACRIVFTVPPGQDPVATRDRVFENLALADEGQSTQGVNTFTDDGDTSLLPGSLLESLGAILGNSPSRSNGINLKPFLDEADGGTGEQLRDGVGASGPTLNPDDFR
ncbi:hypothetical protein XM38_052080 [Halomicronema hongdechloris C2206]|uniref:Circadian oscillating protein COP23 n=1 Tax=Halomicronema hongdechloris C2206 TaxID=1641165 RepID=A0A1Z3HVB4_9CYAN|nr:COP23 domain-containing protein [Halomicronema hongdechloris]ASC74233.1 hypothetical protein XM38_052080 [Halomicronema hongdechloris C2206]